MKTWISVVILLGLMLPLTALGTKAYCENAWGGATQYAPTNYDPKDLANMGEECSNYMSIEEPDAYYWQSVPIGGLHGYQIFCWELPDWAWFVVAGQFSTSIHSVHAWDGSGWVDIGHPGTSGFTYNVTSYASDGALQVLVIRDSATIVTCSYMHVVGP